MKTPNSRRQLADRLRADIPATPVDPVFIHALAEAAASAPANSEGVPMLRTRGFKILAAAAGVALITTGGALAAGNAADPAQEPAPAVTLEQDPLDDDELEEFEVEDQVEIEGDEDGDDQGENEQAEGDDEDGDELEEAVAEAADEDGDQGENEDDQGENEDDQGDDDQDGDDQGENEDDSDDGDEDDSDDGDEDDDESQSEDD